MTEDDWERLDGWADTHRVLGAVDALNKVRGALSSDADGRPSPLLEGLLRLDALADEVIGDEDEARAAELFDLAEALSGQVFTLNQQLEAVEAMLEALAALRPEDDEV
jgi:hypothetical protein